MRWLRFRVRTNSASEDILVDAMSGIGLVGAQIEDKVALTGRELEELFIDEAPLQAIDGDTGQEDFACLSFYSEIVSGDGENLRVKLDGGEELDPDEVRARMEAAIEELKAWSDIGDGGVDISVTDDIDWRDNWKQYFHSFFIDDILVTPSWERLSEDERNRAAFVLDIDPGAAFGTGLHETTRLAVRGIRRVIKGGERLLDVGTGSGILSILGLKFGASFAAAVDLDPLAVAAAKENAARNGIDERSLRVFKGDLTGDAGSRGEVLKLTGGYDVIVANILPPVLIPLSAVLGELLAEGGRVVYSGILKEKAEPVREALKEAGFEVSRTDEDGEWISLSAMRSL